MENFSFFHRSDVGMRIQHLFQQSRAGAGMTAEQGELAVGRQCRGAIKPALQGVGGESCLHVTDALADDFQFGNKLCRVRM